MQAASKGLRAILVTGALGQIGSELIPLPCGYGSCAIAWARS